MQVVCLHCVTGRLRRQQPATGPSQTVPRQRCTVSAVIISLLVVGTGHAARRPSASAAADTNVVLGRALYEEMMYTAYRTIEYYHQATHMPHGTSPGGRCVSRERTDGVLHVVSFGPTLYVHEVFTRCR